MSKKNLGIQMPSLESVILSPRFIIPVFISIRSKLFIKTRDGFAFQFMVVIPKQLCEFQFS